MKLFLHDIVSDNAKRRPTDIAIIEGSKQIPYKELNRKMENLASYMVAMGLKRGERVGLLAKNSVGSIAAYFAISKAGCVSVPLNHALNVEEISRQANDCAISSLYVGAGFETKAKGLVDKTKFIRFVMNEAQETLGYRVSMFPRSYLKSPASIIYTSGTTRRPLGALLTQENLMSNNRAIVKYAHLKSSDKIICVLPIYYIYGLSLVISHFIVGGTVIIETRFAYPNVLLDAIEKYCATGFAGVSSHYIMLLNMSNLANRKLPSLRYFMQAGDKMPPDVAKRLALLFPKKKLYLMYGQTEASPRISYLDPSLVPRKAGSVGKPIEGVRVKIVNVRGKECKEGEEGEITVKGANIMAGYWNNPVQTNTALKKGWLYTGDIGFKDPDGDIFIVGRKKDFIKIGGNRISPAQIEDMVSRLKGIMENVALSFKDPVLGERLKLFVTLVPGSKLEREQIIRFCKANLPAYGVPRDVVVLKNMPKNSLGKIDRESLRGK